MEDTLLLGMILDEDHTLTRSDLLERGFPSDLVPSRSLAQGIKMLQGRGNLPCGGRIVGSATRGGYRWISAEGREICILDHSEEGPLVPEGVPGSEGLEAMIEGLQTSYDRPAIRRILLAWILDLGLRESGYPSLYQAPWSDQLVPQIEQVIAAYPEAMWTTWRAREFGGE